MANRSRPTLMKREREKARLEKQKTKQARRAERSRQPGERPADGVDPAPWSAAARRLAGRDGRGRVTSPFVATAPQPPSFSSSSQQVHCRRTVMRRCRVARAVALHEEAYAAATTSTRSARIPDETRKSSRRTREAAESRISAVQERVSNAAAERENPRTSSTTGRGSGGSRPFTVRRGRAGRRHATARRIAHRLARAGPQRTRARLARACPRVWSGTDRRVGGTWDVSRATAQPSARGRGTRGLPPQSGWR